MMPSHVPKLATYDGSEDWKAFIVPLERIARRHAWSDEEKVDQLFTNLRGAAARFAASLPETTRDNYGHLKAELERRFDRRDPKSTIRRKLNMYRQENETNDVFAEEVRRLVTLAYPNSSWEEQEEFAVDAFLTGLKHSEIAYDVMLKAPTTLAQAQEFVECAVHSYKLTVARKQKHSRRVTFEEEGTEEPVVKRVQNAPQSVSVTPTSVDLKRLEDKMETLFSMVKSLQNVGLSRSSSPERGRARDTTFRRSPSPSPRRDRSPSPNSRGLCFYCKEEGHWRKDCPYLKPENDRGATLTAKSRPNQD
jgi:hypothetical protein